MSSPTQTTMRKEVTVKVQLTTLDMVREAYALAVASEQRHQNLDRFFALCFPGLKKTTTRQKPRIKILGPRHVVLLMYPEEKINV